ncbi:MAG: GxxExxY protein [Chthoniobacterales bacterium]|nr:GxxExxY protein [Chthoniobacterales bacterium]
MREEDVLAKRVLDEAFRLHTELGPGLLESVYEQVLAARLRKAGLQVETQKSISIVIDDLTIPEAFRADLVVDGKLIVELKSVEEMKPVFAKQLLTYLRLSGLKLGLLLNFGAPSLKNGIERVASNL